MFFSNAEYISVPRGQRNYRRDERELRTALNLHDTTVFETQRALKYERFDVIPGNIIPITTHRLPFDRLEFIVYHQRVNARLI